MTAPKNPRAPLPTSTLMQHARDFAQQFTQHMQSCPICSKAAVDGPYCTKAQGLLNSLRQATYDAYKALTTR
jgi:hypothetical protein